MFREVERAFPVPEGKAVSETRRSCWETTSFRCEPAELSLRAGGLGLSFFSELKLKAESGWSGRKTAMEDQRREREQESRFETHKKERKPCWRRVIMELHWH